VTSELHRELSVISIINVVPWAVVWMQPLPQVGETASGYIKSYNEWVSSSSENTSSRAEALAYETEFVTALDQIGPLTTDVNSAEWEDMVLLIGSNRDFLDDVREFANKEMSHSLIELDLEKHTIPIGEVGLLPVSQLVIKGTFSDLSRVRKIVKLLAIDAIVASRVGDTQMVLADLKAIGKYAQSTPRLNSRIEYLVARGILFGITESILNNNIAINHMTIHELASLNLTLDCVYESISPAMTVQTEEWAAQDALEWLYEDQIDGRFGPRGIDRFLYVVYEYENKKLNIKDGDIVKTTNVLNLLRKIGDYDSQKAFTNKFFYAVNGDYGVAPYTLNALQSDKLIEDSTKDNNSISSSLMPGNILVDSVRNVIETEIQAITSINAVRLLISIIGYQQLHGSMPSNLSDLHCINDESRMIDGFSGNDLVFQVSNNNSFKIYSVGSDRDDDGGVGQIYTNGEAMVYPEFYFQNEISTGVTDLPNGDWILYSGNVYTEDIDD